MRILHWTDNFLPCIGGVETFLWELARVQQAAGHEVHICTGLIPGQPAEEAGPGFTVHRRPLRDDILLHEPRRFRELIDACAALRRRLCPDLVHVHYSQIGPWLELLSRPEPSGPILLTTHSPLIQVGTPRPLTTRILGAADVVTAVSADLAAVVEAGYPGACSGGIKVILNGVAWPGLEPTPLRAVPGVLLALGRVVEVKGFDLAVRALPGLPGLRLIIAGDGVERRALEALVVALNVADRVEFAGWIHPAEVPAMINRADIVLMPSRWREPFGLVAVQAGQMGRPLVATRIGGLPEIVRDGETGLLVAPESPEALAVAVRSLCADPVRARTLGAAARERVRRDFSLERCAADYEVAYVLAAGVRARRQAG